MATKTARRKNSAAATLGRKGGLKGGPARAAKLTPSQRSESARRAVQARWSKSKPTEAARSVTPLRRNTSTPRINSDVSDAAVLALLKRIKMTSDLNELRKLTDQLERAIFHKQYARGA